MIEQADDVREVGPVDIEAQAAKPPVLLGLVLCRRALCDAGSGMHTLVDVLLDVVVPQLPGQAGFDVYLQLRGITGPVTIVLEVAEATSTRDDAVLATGTLTLRAAPSVPDAAAPPSLGIAVPGVMTTFARAGEHRVRVRCGSDLLGERSFAVVAAPSA